MTAPKTELPSRNINNQSSESGGGCVRVVGRGKEKGPWAFFSQLLIKICWNIELD